MKENSHPRGGNFYTQVPLGGPGRIRTVDLCHAKAALYPAELQAPVRHFISQGKLGLNMITKNAVSFYKVLNRLILRLGTVEDKREKYQKKMNLLKMVL